MKPVTITLIAALVSSNIAFAQSAAVKKTDQTPAMNMQKCSDMMEKNRMGMKGMDMKGMDMKGMDMKSMDAEKCKDMMNDQGSKGATKNGMPMTHTARAVVKSVDAANGKVTLSHEAVKSLNWPAMTMAFPVKDKALLDKLTVGKKVNVEFAKEGADYVITAVK
jgi:Cu(I)/Ag(I) efflux system protein CusF